MGRGAIKNRGELTTRMCGTTSDYPGALGTRVRTFYVRRGFAYIISDRV